MPQDGNDPAHSDNGAPLDAPPLLRSAQQYLDARLSVLAANVAEKRPVLASWKPFQKRLPTPQELVRWLPRAKGICLVAGAVSGNLELLDFDCKAAVYGAWRELVQEAIPGLLDKLVIERSQSGGMHVVYRSDEKVPGNTHLAQRAVDVDEPDEVELFGKKWKPRKCADGKYRVILTLIETRGEGGIFLCDPTPGYVLQQGSFEALPVITAEERECLWEAAYALNEYYEPPKPCRESNSPMGDRPGDDFNRRGDVRPILREHGWTLAKGGENEYWRRPGKDRGWSASLKGQVFYCFSGNAVPFEMNKAYAPFAVFALLVHDGDFSAAASDLRDRGYGATSSAAAPSSQSPRPEEWDPPLPFGRANLPEFPGAGVPKQLWELWEFWGAVAESYQVPVDLPAMLGLSICAAAVAKRINVHASGDHIEPCNLFVVVVMEPGERKSAVFQTITAPFEDFERQENEQLAPEIQKNEIERAILTKAIEVAKTDAAKAKKQVDSDAARKRLDELLERYAQMPVIRALRLIVDDATPEAVARLLAEQGGRIAALSPEGDVFELMSGRYSANGNPNLGVYLKGHAGDNLRVDRVSKDRPHEHVQQPALTIGLAVQPDVLRGLLQKPVLRGRGVLARFFYSIPKSKVGYRRIDPQAVPSKVRSQYQALVRSALCMKPRVDDEGKPTAFVVALSTDAVQRLNEFRLYVEEQLRDGGELAAIADWGNKLVGLVCRIAGVYHGLIHSRGDPSAEPISAEVMNCSIAVGHYAIAHAKAAFIEMGANPAVGLARRIATWLEKTERASFTRRDAYQQFKGSIHRVDALDAPLQLLIEHAYIRERPHSRAGPGRKPSQLFEVNPACAPHNSQNPQNSCSAQVDGQSTDGGELPNGSTPHNSHYPQNSGDGMNCEDSGNTEGPNGHTANELDQAPQHGDEDGDAEWTG